MFIHLFIENNYKMCYFAYRNHLFDNTMSTLEINTSITKHFILQAQLIFMLTG